jgi:hypothetical protein
MPDVIYDGSLTMDLNDYRGLSAYEIAVKHGFVGSEEEWLKSLKGEPGKAADAITVNKKRPVDGNISVNGSDINLRPGVSKTVADAVEELSNNLQDPGLKVSDIVNDLTTGGEKKVLSAEMGARLEHTKPDVFWAEVEIPIGEWAGEGPYTRDLSISGVLAASNLCAIQYSATVDSEDAFIAANLRVVGQKDDAITVRVDSIPTEAFPINVMVTILKTRGDVS